MSKVVVPQEIEALASATVNAALTVHRALGPGLLESAYHECLLIELKAIDALQPIHRIQVTTDLRLLKLPLGLLINFNVPLIKDGITRVLNLDFRTPAESSDRGPTPHRPPHFAPTIASSRLRA